MIGRHSDLILMQIESAYWNFTATTNYVYFQHHKYRYKGAVATVPASQLVNLGSFLKSSHTKRL